jgi:hypothetical protein
MFEKPIDERLSIWFNFRKDLEEISDPLRSISYFWGDAPQIVHNTKLDPYNPKSWPTPWEIIVHNKYDDFTKAIMIGYTILSTDRFKNSKVQIKTLVDNDQNRLYNVVCVDDVWALNLRDSEAVSIDNIPSLYRLENLVELSRPR